MAIRRCLTIAIFAILQNEMIAETTYVMSDETTGSAELYTACRSTNQQIQAAAYTELARYLYRVALHLVNDQPEADELARDCVQTALIYVHQRIADCREPAAFRIWARRIASHTTIDELRRRKRIVPLIDDEADNSATPLPAFEASVLDQLSLAELGALINAAPISARSRRVVLGRYLADLSDEQLSASESEIAGQPVHNSHIQVTRAKDITKLRNYPPLRQFLRPVSE